MKKHTITLSLLLAGVTAVLAAQQTAVAPYPTPTGTPTENGLAGFAKILCSAVFVSGRDDAEAARNSAYFFMPRAEQEAVKWTIDRGRRVVTASFGETSRSAQFYGDQGCIIQNPSKPGIHFKPVAVRTTLPAADSQAWPMGDRLDAKAVAATGANAELLTKALDAAFGDPAALTQSFLVLHKGQIVAERYAPGVTKDTQLENWSMGKSLTATLFALLVKDGTYKIDEPAPVPLWRAAGDPRGAITNRHLLQMSAGLKFVGNQEPGGSPTNTVLDHYYIYTGGIDAFEFSITRPLEAPPGTIGRYRNCDPLTIGYLVKRAVQARGEEYLTFPQRRLFDKIGIRRQVLETDPYGNFLLTGYDYGTARNWARLGLLYLRDGVWNGERLLPEGWTKFVSTHAPAWKQPEYGGFFWLNGIKNWNLPPETYLAAGAGGQNTWIVPGHDLVIVRMGHMRGQGAARRGTNEALSLVMQAIGSTFAPR